MRRRREEQVVTEVLRREAGGQSTLVINLGAPPDNGPVTLERMEELLKESARDIKRARKIAGRQLNLAARIASDSPTPEPTDSENSSAGQGDENISSATAGGSGGGGVDDDPLMVYHRMDPRTRSDEEYLSFLQTPQNPPVKMFVSIKSQGPYVARQIIARLRTGDIYEGSRTLEAEPAVIPGITPGASWETSQLTRKQIADNRWDEVVSKGTDSFMVGQPVKRSLAVNHPELVKNTRFRRNQCKPCHFHHMVWKVNCHYSSDATMRLVTMDRCDGSTSTAGCFHFVKESRAYNELYGMIVATDADNLRLIRDTSNAYDVPP